MGIEGSEGPATAWRGAHLTPLWPGATSAGLRAKSSRGSEGQAGLGPGGAGTRGLTLNLPPNTGDAGGAIAVSPRACPRQLEEQSVGGEAGGRLVSPGSLGAESQRDPPLP